MKKKSVLKWWVGGAVIAAAVLSTSFLKLGDNLLYFYTPSEAMAQASGLSNKTIKLAGMVKGGSVVWQPEALSLAFVLTDLNGHEIVVAHKGTPPDMFKENQGVVVEGRLAADGASMVSRGLLVKHSEEYKAPGPGQSMDKALLEKSLFEGHSN